MATPYPTCYLNGEYLPLAEARISPLDRGFLFADGVYEVVPVHRGRPFRLREHLKRLDDSLRSIRMTNPLDRGRVDRHARAARRGRRSAGAPRLPAGDARRRIRAQSPDPAATSKPTVFAFASPYPAALAPRPSSRDCAP